MPSQQFAALAAPQDHDLEVFRLRHAILLVRVVAVQFAAPSLRARFPWHGVMSVARCKDCSVARVRGGAYSRSPLLLWLIQFAGPTNNLTTARLHAHRRNSQAPCAKGKAPTRVIFKPSSSRLGSVPLRQFMRRSATAEMGHEPPSRLTEAGGGY